MEINNNNDNNKKNERRGPDSELQMRYFKIPLCRNFVWKVRDFSGRMTRVSVVLGQKLGYDTCLHRIRVLMDENPLFPKWFHVFLGVAKWMDWLDMNLLAKIFLMKSI